MNNNDMSLAVLLKIIQELHEVEKEYASDLRRSYQLYQIGIYQYQDFVSRSLCLRLIQLRLKKRITLYEGKVVMKLLDHDYHQTYRKQEKNGSSRLEKKKTRLEHWNALAYLKFDTNRRLAKLDRQELKIMYRSGNINDEQYRDAMNQIDIKLQKEREEQQSMNQLITSQQMQFLEDGVASRLQLRSAKKEIQLYYQKLTSRKANDKNKRYVKLLKENQWDFTHRCFKNKTTNEMHP